MTPAGQDGGNATPRPVARVAGLAPYRLADLAAAPGAPAVSLAQNESLRGPSPEAVAAAARALDGADRYPDPECRALRHAIADRHGLDPEAILCGAGSLELIRALAAAYLGPRLRAAQPAHAYGYFRTATALAGAETDIAPERGCTVDVAALGAAVGPRTRLVWLANPANPTSTAIPGAEVARLRDALPGDVLLVIDEAYGEFADGAPCWPLVHRGDTVVLRSFSKAYALPGLRVGWGLFPPAIAAEIRKVLAPNSVPAPAQAAAAAAMSDDAYMRETVALTAAIRARFAADARALGLAVPESRTNFVLLGFADPAAAGRVHAALSARGFVLRGTGGQGLSRCLRATVGPEPVMRALAAALAEVLEARDLP